MIVLDANALMMPVECDVRLFDGLDRVLGGLEGVDPADPDYVVPAAVVAELESLAAGGGEAATAAGVGLDLVDRCRVIDADADRPGGDAAVLALAERADAAAVVTNDRDLAEAVLARGRPVIGLRSGDKLVVTQP